MNHPAESPEAPRAAGSPAVLAIRSAAARLLGWWSPIIVSNRAPVEPLAAGGYRRGSGGLVTALITVAEATGADWVAAARNPNERTLSASGVPLEVRREGLKPVQVHFVDSGPGAYQQHYAKVCNPLLWFLQHYLWNLTYEPVIDRAMHRAWTEGYQRVNLDLADRVAKVARASPRRPLVLFQDYQLYLAPAAVRRQLSDAVMQQFIHIPWPEPHYWLVLPREFRNAIIDGLTANDVVGFQTPHDVTNFLATCEEVRGLRVDHRDQVVLSAGRLSWARSYPISIDVEGMSRAARAADVRALEAEIRDLVRGKLIVRVDRCDPAKNIIRGFLAFERLLLESPEWRRQVTFFAFLQPSRQDVKAYRDYAKAVRAHVARINYAFRSDDWEPIHLEMGENQRRALALYASYDVLLVNSILDGMNLVAKEGPVINRQDGVLVLSESAGAHQELGHAALSINPFDVENTAAALRRALVMPGVERRHRAQEMRSVVEANDIARWVRLQLQDLHDLVGPVVPPAH